MSAQELPQPIKDGITFWPIPETTRPEQVFGLDGASYFDRRNLPNVPPEYIEKVGRLFFEGGTLPTVAKGVDRTAAAARMRALLTSFAPAHESKMATAGYALWVWSTPSIVSAQESAA